MFVFSTVWTFYFLLTCLILHQTNSSDNKRHKRYLIFTKDTQWGVFATVSIPLHPETLVSVAWFIEANYYTVDNATWFDPLLGDIQDGIFQCHLEGKYSKYWRETILLKGNIPLFLKRNKAAFKDFRKFSCHSWDSNQVSRSEQKRSAQESKDILTRKRLYTFIESMLEKHGYAGRTCLLLAICENAAAHFLHNGLPGDILHLILTPSTSIAEDDLDDYYYEAEYLGMDHLCERYFYNCPSSPLELISINAESFL